MAYDTKGTLIRIFETKQVSDKFRKREFVVEVPDGKYPQTVLFQATGDRCDLLDTMGEGEEVKVTWNLRGREWRSPSGETKYFNSCDAWKIESVGAAPQQSRPAPTASGGGAPDDDLPF